jgi:hypothetical protein
MVHFLATPYHFGSVVARLTSAELSTSMLWSGVMVSIHIFSFRSMESVAVGTITNRGNDKFVLS